MADQSQPQDVPSAGDAITPESLGTPHPPPEPIPDEMQLDHLEIRHRSSRELHRTEWLLIFAYAVAMVVMMCGMAALYHWLRH